jgi:peptidoglycan/xylan/chitin deacetylase (PgdA/CDA1 family)
VSWSGIPLVEIPPVPPGHALIACLTHDVDHPSVRRHKWDHTALGFLYRACVGSVIKVCRRRAAVRDLLANWAAAARLPLVHLGIARDFWGDWTRYAAVDGGTGSTFFVIPVGDYPGQTPFSRSAPAHRAARYGAEDIAEQIRSVTASGCEIAVHGIDAWLDSSKGREELAEVSRVAGATATGVRMHWLYGHETSPLVLEEAGFTYDSTSGYNETIGYRAGTTQVFKPLAAKRLLELPMHVMDTALFYPRHLDLAPAEATRRVTAIIDDAVRFGGIVTINWHDRSMAPERQWGRVYGRLLRDLRRRGAWFPTASQAVSWFRKRRSAVFQAVSWDGDVVSARIGGATSDGLPGLRLRVHRPETYWDGRQLGVQPSIGYVEVSVNDTIDTSVRL